MKLPYSGAALRTGQYDSRPAVPGVNPQHFKGAPTLDIFTPDVATPAAQQGDIWADGTDEYITGHNWPNLAQVPVDHWFDGGQPAVSGLPYASAQQEMQTRMMADHSQDNYVPDVYRQYLHAGQGTVRGFDVGRMPQHAGETLPEGSQYLANGRNSYDQTNGATDVYGGAGEGMTGRYRLGVKTTAFGVYDNPLGLFGQTASLRAYAGLQPQFPVDKTLPDNLAPYTPSSNGAQAFMPPATSWNAPSSFGLPAETAMTDYAVATEQPAPAQDFYDSAGEFQ